MHSDCYVDMLRWRNLAGKMNVRPVARPFQPLDAQLRVLIRKALHA